MNTEAEAKQKTCPISLANPLSCAPYPCAGQQCMAWRWMQAYDAGRDLPHWASTVEQAAIAKERGWPQYGYCGMAGAVE